MQRGAVLPQPLVDPGEAQELLIQPGTKVTPIRDGLLELPVIHDSTGDGIDQEHLPRLQAALLDDAFGIDLDGAHLGRADDAVIVGHVVSARTETVSIQIRAAVSTVREGEEGRTVPGFHHAGRPLVEGRLGRIHGVVVLPRLGHHEHDGFGQRQHAVDDQQLEHVVEGGRVGSTILDDRVEGVELVGEEVGFQDTLTGTHPVLVAAQRVDLACPRSAASHGSSGEGGLGSTHHCERPTAAVALDPSWGKY